MKGIELPMNTIVIIVIVVLVLTVIGYFFYSSTTGPLSRAEAESIFTQGCSTLCKGPEQSAYFLSHISDEDHTDFYTQFANACIVLGHATDPEHNVEQAKACMAACGSCDTNFDTEIAWP